MIINLPYYFDFEKDMTSSLIASSLHLDDFFHEFGVKIGNGKQKRWFRGVVVASFHGIDSFLGYFRSITSNRKLIEPKIIEITGNEILTVKSVFLNGDFTEVTDSYGKYGRVRNEKLTSFALEHVVVGQLIHVSLDVDSFRHRRDDNIFFDNGTKYFLAKVQGDGNIIFPFAKNVSAPITFSSVDGDLVFVEDEWLVVEAQTKKDSTQIKVIKKMGCF